MKAILLILCISLAMPACGQSPKKSPEKQTDELIKSMIKPGSPGATVAVAKGGQVVFSKGYGLANPEYDIANTPATIFHVASVSKQFTAFAIALLADQGKISLNDDIRKYFPEFHDFGHKVTIKHLAHHTSGLRDQWNLLALAGWRLDDVITLNQVLRLISHQRELNFPPGEQFSYCNTGYTLMAEIVSRVSGKTFAEWCSENIFQPLEMTNTFFYDDHEKIVKNRAYSYHESPDGLKKSVLSYANAGATSLFTTAEDLTKWARNFKTMKAGNPAVMKQMEERGILNKGDTIGYAFGQGIGRYKGITLISHDGADAGYRSSLLRFPDHDYSIAVLSNFASFSPGKLALGIADIYLKDYLKEDPASEKKDPPPGEVKVSEQLLKMYEGQFQLTDAMVLTFTAENGKLKGQATGQPSFPLEARSDNEFALDQHGIKIVFNRSADKVNDITFTQGGWTTVAKRVNPFDPKSLDLDEYAGTYYSPELETSYTIEVKNDTLIANHIRHEPVTLNPTAKDTFIAEQWFMSKVDFTRSEKFVVNGIRVSSGRVRNVRFVKQPSETK